MLKEKKREINVTKINKTSTLSYFSYFLSAFLAVHLVEKKSCIANKIVNTESLQDTWGKYIFLE